MIARSIELNHTVMKQKTNTNTLAFAKQKKIESPEKALLFSFSLCLFSLIGEKKKHARTYVNATKGSPAPTNE